MRVTLALLADAATVERGKLYIHGGGWRSINAESFPAVHPSMALVFTVLIEDHEVDDELPLNVALAGGHDSSEVALIEGVVSRDGLPRPQAGSPVVLHNALTLAGLRFDAPGLYIFRISSGDDTLKEIPLKLVLSTDEPVRDSASS